MLKLSLFPNSLRSRPPSSVVFEQGLCPCGAQAGFSTPYLQSIDFVNNIPGYYSIVRCSSCGLLRTNPRPSVSSIGVYYPDSYAPYSKVLAKRKTFFSRIIYYLLGRPRLLPVSKPGKALEIGCSNGDYMMTLQDKGWSVTGLDVTQSVVDHARSNGLDVHLCDFSTYPTLGIKYDLVCAWMVLEHLHNPNEALAFFKSVLSPKGKLVFSIPHIDSLLHLIFGPYDPCLHLPNHLHHFTYDSIRSLMSRNGFKVIKIRRVSSSSGLIHSIYNYASYNNSTILLTLATFLRGSSKLSIIINILIALLSRPLSFSGKIEVWAIHAP